MKAAALGEAGLKGWRGTVAKAVAPPISKRSGLSEDNVRSLIGVLFLILSVLYVVKSFQDLVGRAKD